MARKRDGNAGIYGMNETRVLATRLLRGNPCVLGDGDIEGTKKDGLIGAILLDLGFCREIIRCLKSVSGI